MVEKRVKKVKVISDDLMNDIKASFGLIYKAYENKSEKKNKGAVLKLITSELGLGFLSDKRLRALSVSADVNNIDTLKKVFKGYPNLDNLKVIINRTLINEVLFPTVETPLQKESLNLAFDTVQNLRRDFLKLHEGMKISDMKYHLYQEIYLDNWEDFRYYDGNIHVEWFLKKLFSKRIFENDEPYKLISNELCGKLIKMLLDYKIK